MTKMFELFDDIIKNYGARYTNLQKQDFCVFVEKYLQKYNLNCIKESNKKNTNIIIGDLNCADLIITAHYDTVNEHRFPFLCGVTNNLLNSFKYFFSSYISFITAKNTENINNYNDNTSGVCCALQLAKIKNKRVAFVLFDNEENNLLGSRIFYKKYKHVLNNKLILNLDCVGCGDYVGIVYYTYFNSLYADKLLSYFQKSGKAFKMIPSNIYNTDAKIFKKSLTVSCYYKEKNNFNFYNIHTKNDNIIEKNNLIRVVEDLTFYIKEILPNEER